MLILSSELDSRLVEREDRTSQMRATKGNTTFHVVVVAVKVQLEPGHAK